MKRLIFLFAIVASHAAADELDDVNGLCKGHFSMPARAGSPVSIPTSPTEPGWEFCVGVREKFVARAEQRRKDVDAEDLKKAQDLLNKIGH